MKKNVEFRYYEIPDEEMILPLVGPVWKKTYGEGPDRLHFHNYYEVGICYEGEGEMTLGNEVKKFGPGCISAIPPSVLHTTNTYGKIARWEWLYFDMSKVMEMVVPDDTIIRATARYQLLEKAMLFTPEVYPDRMKVVLSKIFDEANNKSYLYQHVIKCMLPALVIEIIRLSKNYCPVTRKSGKKIGIEPAIEYVNLHYDSAIKISTLAEVCNMSESHFRKIFGEYMNMKPVDYINYIKVRKSCSLLKSTNLSIGEITAQIGYESQATYIRNFRKIIGKTPLQWKKSDEEERAGAGYNITAQKGWLE